MVKVTGGWSCKGDMGDWSCLGDRVGGCEGDSCVDNPWGGKDALIHNFYSVYFWALKEWWGRLNLQNT